MMVTDPFTAPAVVGANVACSAEDPPAGIVNGTATPLTLNPTPLTVSCEMFTSLVPEFWTVTACVLLPFTSTFPYFKLLVLKESWEATLPDAPFKCTLVEPPPCAVMAVSVPETVPVLPLRNAILNMADSPAPRFKGKLNPDVVNAGEEELSCVTLTV